MNIFIEIQIIMEDVRVKVPLFCMECFEENGIPNFKYKKADITDDGLYELECCNDHRTNVILQSEKFEILFDMGAQALLEGYKHEAVVCMTTAVERFHEWCIKVISKKHNTPVNELTKTWKYVSNQSERQLGAYYLLCLMEFGKAPNEFSSQMSGFRNKVIHKGYIPTYEEVFRYGEYVLDYIRNMLIIFERDYNKYIFELSMERQFILLEKCKEGASSMSVTTIIGLNYNEEKHKNQSFEQALEFLRKRSEFQLS